MSCPVTVAAMVIALLPVAKLSACGDDGDRSARITRAHAVSLKQRPDGRLERAPSPLTARDVSRIPRRSPRQTVTALWFYAQWGSFRNVFDLYDSRVQRAMGGQLVAGAYQGNRPYILSVRPRITSVTRTPRGTLVTVELLTANDPPGAESFLLRKVKGEWRILFDTYLNSTPKLWPMAGNEPPAIATYAQNRVQERIAPGSTKPLPEAVAAGSRASRRFRGLSLSPPPASTAP